MAPICESRSARAPCPGVWLGHRVKRVHHRRSHLEMHLGRQASSGGLVCRQSFGSFRPTHPRLKFGARCAFRRGVVASVSATTADLLGSYAHPAVAGRTGQAGAVASDRDPGRRRNLGTGVARPSDGTHTPPEKNPRACGQRRAVPGYLFQVGGQQPLHPGPEAAQGDLVLHPGTEIATLAGVGGWAEGKKCLPGPRVLRPSPRTVGGVRSNECKGGRTDEHLQRRAKPGGAPGRGVPRSLAAAAA